LGMCQVEFGLVGFGDTAHHIRIAVITERNRHLKLSARGDDQRPKKELLLNSTGIERT